MFQEKINFEEAKNKALEFVKKKGPSMPTQVAKEIGIPPLFAAALLSQLISEKAVKVSHLKVGGSPLYYAETDKEKLVNFINYLPNVEKDVCEKLKNKGVIADENMPLAEKVALRNIKDFSVPLSVKIGERKKLFWRWFSFPQENALELINKYLKIREKDTGIKTEISEKGEVKLKKEEEGEKKERKEKEAVKEKRVRIIKPKINFLVELKKFLETNKVKVLEENIIRRDREVEFVLQLDSSLGKINFFAIAKNKKVITPGDLTLAYYKSQEKKLPLIFLCTGRFSKKTEEKAHELGVTLKSLEEKI
ncbi:hypothetical protein B6U80_00140 [Candidatus Pacearchaeota archaeon ex4484_26]|nr:MAG: hypothetical protein B6U80_00140 [Candidatus Pacearchaeota archaeon ex4484_26]